HPHRRLHVREDGNAGVRAQVEPGAEPGARGRRRRDAGARRVPAAAVRGGRSVGEDTGRAGDYRGAAVDSRVVTSSILTSLRPSTFSNGAFSVRPRHSELFHKVRYTRPRLLGAGVSMAPKTSNDRWAFLGRSARRFQENVERAGPAAGAGYALIG